MTKQSRTFSLLETLCQTIVGFILAWVASLYIIPMFLNVGISRTQGFGITLVYTVLSFVRSYIIRRAFNHGR